MQDSHSPGGGDLDQYQLAAPLRVVCKHLHRDGADARGWGEEEWCSMVWSFGVVGCCGVGWGVHLAWCGVGCGLSRPQWDRHGPPNQPTHTSSKACSCSSMPLSTSTSANQ